MSSNCCGTVPSSHSCQVQQRLNGAEPLYCQFWLVPHSGMGEDTNSGEDLVTFWQKSHNKHSQPFSIVLSKCQSWLKSVARQLLKPSRKLNLGPNLSTASSASF